MIYNADSRELSMIEDKSIQCVVTSPPYYGLRDYGVDGQIGLEKTPEEYVRQLVIVFREVWRKLKDDGTLWLNIGDSYASRPQNGDEKYSNNINTRGNTKRCRIQNISKTKRNSTRWGGGNIQATGNIKPKDLIGIPWMVAFALRADGWYLRSEIIWEKPNPMPESVTDRPIKSHEQVFLLTKSPRYFYDAMAIREITDNLKGYANGFRGGSYCKNETFDNSEGGHRKQTGNKQRKPAGWDGSRQGAHGSFHRYGRAADIEYVTSNATTRNKRDVWVVATQPFVEAHFATFPEKLVEPCILAGSRPGDIVLDPFCGAGTVGVVAKRFGRQFVGVEINQDYIKIAEIRIDKTPNCLFQGINYSEISSEVN